MKILGFNSESHLLCHSAETFYYTDSVLCPAFSFCDDTHAAAHVKLCSSYLGHIRIIPAALCIDSAAHDSNVLKHGSIKCIALQRSGAVFKISGCIQVFTVGCSTVQLQQYATTSGMLVM